MKDDTCIFCKIANGEIPSRTVYEEENFRVFLDLSPATKGHMLVVPKEHYASIHEMPEDLLSDAVRIGKKMAALAVEKLQADGVNLIQNNGEAAGQTVKHYHLHIIPRYQNDGQNILWEPGSMTDEELDQIRDTLTAG